MRNARLILALFLMTQGALAQEKAGPNSPDFDPVAHMRRFDPAWQAPEISQEALAPFALGSYERPVRAQGPQGQRDYLSRLVCPDGKAATFWRVGSLPEKGVYGFHVDAYEVSCGGSSNFTVHMDMYHPRYIEQEAVPGFTLRH